MTFKLRDVDLEVKASDDSGTFSGYGSVFDVVDHQKEKVLSGAFADSIAEQKAKGRKFPILWQHKTEQPLGTYSKVEEDSRGLFVEGRLLIKEVAAAKEAHALLRDGAVSGLSIGFWPRESSLDEKTGIRSLIKVDLGEISLVTHPSNDDARIDAVKLKLARGGLPTLPEFERVLRDAGFSRNQAVTIASYGLKHLLRDAGDPANATAVGALIERLNGFTLPKI